MNSENDTSPDFVSAEQYDSSYAYKVIGIFAALVLIVMYIEGMLTPSLGQIETDFLITPAQASLVLSMYMVGGVAFAPIVGKLGDIYGKKKLLVITLSIYAVAVSVTGFSPSFMFMVVSRTVQGIGLAIMPLGFSLVREEFPKDLIPKAQAIISAMFGAGFAISLPLGSLVSNDYGWRWTYHSAIPVIVALVVVAVFVVKESRFRRPEVKVDYAGAIMLAVSLSLFVLALSEGPTWGWETLSTLGMLAAGAILLVPLVLFELGYSVRGEAILNFKLLSMRNVLVANIVLAVAGLGMFLSQQALTYRFLYGFGKSTLGAGISLVPFALGTVIFGPIAGIFVSRTGVKPLAVFGSLLSALGFLLLATLPDYNGVLMDEFVIGAGFSFLNATLINYIVLTVRARDMGLATSMNSTFRFLGSSIGAPIAGSISSIYSTTATVQSLNGGFETITVPTGTAFSLIFMIAAVVFVAMAFLIPLGREVLGRKGLGKGERIQDLAGTVAEAD